MEEEALAQAPSHPRSSSSHGSSKHQRAKLSTGKESRESTAGPGRFSPQVAPQQSSSAPGAPARAGAQLWLLIRGCTTLSPSLCPLLNGCETLALP